jgi:hypothetical protein
MEAAKSSKTLVSYCIKTQNMNCIFNENFKSYTQRRLLLHLWPYYCLTVQQETIRCSLLHDLIEVLSMLKKFFQQNHFTYLILQYSRYCKWFFQCPNTLHTDINCDIRISSPSMTFRITFQISICRTPKCMDYFCRPFQVSPQIKLTIFMVPRTDTLRDILETINNSDFSDLLFDV